MSPSIGDYPRPAVTTDVVLITDEPDPRVLLIVRGHEPAKGSWALPGGFVEVGDVFTDQGEDLIEGAYRELHEETGISRELLASHGVELVQIGAFGTPYRDARLRIITIGWVGRVPAEVVAHTTAGDDADDARWWPLSTLDHSTIAFDHADILAAGLQRIG